MIENRARIEKQILLGRQAVHHAIKNKSRSTSHEPRHLLHHKSNRETGNQLQGLSTSLSPPPSGSEPPLSVDTDAEAAFARGSRFYRRGRTSKNHSPNSEKGIEQHTAATRRRPWTPEQTDEEKDAEVVTEAPSPQTHGNNVPTTSSFLSKLRTNSTPKLSLPSPFSLDQRTPSVRDSGADNQGEYNWSSESSTDEYPLDD